MQQNLEIQQILKKAESLRGYTINELANYYNISNLKKFNQNDFTHIKGHSGILIEYVLGSTAKSKPLPDFPELNLEIKTIPIDINNNVIETTYICTAPLHYHHLHDHSFEQSVVYKKLQHILWVPIIAQNEHRVIGNSFLWQPNNIEFNQIKTDWLELTDMILMGHIEQLNSHYGAVLQIRPKAANSKALTSAVGTDGENISTLPRGYYLRTSFTQNIYNNNQLSYLFD